MVVLDVVPLYAPKGYRASKKTKRTHIAPNKLASNCKRAGTHVCQYLDILIFTPDELDTLQARQAACGIAELLHSLWKHRGF